MVDRKRLFALIERIREETVHLRRLGALSDIELEADPERLAGAKYRFVVAIEACIDAARHVIASEGLRYPADYFQAFEVIAEAGFLPKEQLPSLKAMVGFRNLLVHVYAKVEDEKVVEILRQHLGDFDSFREAIAEAIHA
jgi:uncharacterized protein YutE (UPF0331/DUF86 family)